MSNLLIARMKQEAAKRHGLGVGEEDASSRGTTLNRLVRQPSPCQDVTLCFPFLLPPSPTALSFHPPR